MVYLDIQNRLQIFLVLDQKKGYNGNELGHECLEKVISFRKENHTNNQR